MSRDLERIVRSAMGRLRETAERRGADPDDLMQEGRIAGYRADQLWHDGGVSWTDYVYRRVLTAMTRALKKASLFWRRGSGQRTPTGATVIPFDDLLASGGEVLLGVEDVEERQVGAEGARERLDRLTPSERAFVEARWGDGFGDGRQGGRSREVIAEEVGCSTSTIARRVRAIRDTVGREVGK